MAAISLTYTLTNGTTADASQVMQNLNDIVNGTSDGTKDLSINALTLAGALTANGNVTIGNASADDLTVNASLASTIPIKTTNSYDIGSSTLGLRALYFGANSQTVNVKGSASMSATWTLTLPVTAGTNNYLLKTNGSGVTSWSQIDTTAMFTTGAEVTQSAPGVVKSAGQLKGTNTDDTAGAGYVGEILSPGSASETVGTSATTVSTQQLTAGHWLAIATLNYNGTAGNAFLRAGISSDTAFTGTTDGVSSAYIATISASGVGGGTVFRSIFVANGATPTFRLIAQFPSTSANVNALLQFFRVR